MRHSLFKYLSLGCLALLMISGCATAYHLHPNQGALRLKHKKQLKQKEPLSDYFQKIQLAKNTYHIGVTGTSSDSWKEISAILLRSCAAVTLAHGKRYFTLFNSISNTSMASAAASSTYFYYKKDLYNRQIYYEQTIMKIAPDNKKSKKLILDAVTIIKSTNWLDKGSLSKKARETLNQFEDLGSK